MIDRPLATDVSTLSPRLIERCGAIELLVLDVDGVSTDGSILIDDRGVEIKRFHVRDGGGIAAWRKAGKRVAILSARRSAAVEVRCRELGVETVLQGADDKREEIVALARSVGVSSDRVCFMGDDLADLGALEWCGLAICPADAAAEAIASAHYVTRHAGGRGAVREAIELILRVQGRWEEIVAGYRFPGGGEASVDGS